MDIFPSLEIEVDLGTFVIEFAILNASSANDEANEIWFFALLKSSEFKNDFAFERAAFASFNLF